MKKVLALFFTLILLISCVVTGCFDINDQATSTNPEPTSFQKTNTLLASNGMSDYKIVIPSKNIVVERYIAEELQYYLQQSTGAKLAIITDENIVYDNSQKHLSIGNTTILQQQKDIVVDYDVQGAAGPLIYTKDNTVYMTGADRYGITNAVYKFLEYQIGFRAYANDCVLFDYFDELYLINISYNYVPSIQWLALNEYETYGEEHIEEAARMLRIGYCNDGGKEIFGRKTFSGFWCHSCLGIFPETVTYTDETTGETIVKDVYQYGQPCLSDMHVLEAAAQSLLSSLLSSDGPALMVGMKDSGATCICEGCLALQEKFATQGGVMLNALNVMAEKIESSLKEMNVERKVTLVGLVYNGYLGAPTKINEAGETVLASEEMVAFDGDLIDVGVCIAPMHCCFSHPLGEESCETNISFTQNIKNWTLATDELYFYIYGNNFSGCQTYFYNDWAALPSTFKFFDEIGAKYVFVESSGFQYSPFSAFRVYLKSRLGWNANLQFKDICDEFFPAYYGPAGYLMREYFDELNEHFEYIYQVKSSFHLGCYENTNSTDYYPYISIKSYENILTKAFDVINTSNCTKTDKEIYNERINREFLLLKYNEYMLYKESVDAVTKAELEVYVKQIKDIYGIG